MNADVWLVIATVALFGLSNAALLIYKIGAIEARQKSQDERIDRLETVVFSGTAQPAGRRA